MPSCSCSSALRAGGPLGNNAECRVQILHGVLGGSAYDDLAALLYPLGNGSGAKSEPSADLGRDGHLPSCGEPGLSKSHRLTLLHYLVINVSRTLARTNNDQYVCAQRAELFSRFRFASRIRRGRRCS